MFDHPSAPWNHFGSAAPPDVDNIQVPPSGQHVRVRVGSPGAVREQTYAEPGSVAQRLNMLEEALARRDDVARRGEANDPLEAEVVDLKVRLSDLERRIDELDGC